MQFNLGQLNKTIEQEVSWTKIYWTKRQLNNWTTGQILNWTTAHWTETTGQIYQNNWTNGQLNKCSAKRLPLDNLMPVHENWWGLPCLACNRPDPWNSLPGVLPPVHGSSSKFTREGHRRWPRAVLMRATALIQTTTENSVPRSGHPLTTFMPWSKPQLIQAMSSEGCNNFL